MRFGKFASVGILSLTLTACSQPAYVAPANPALEYTTRLKAELGGARGPGRTAYANQSGEPRAMVRFASDELPPEETPSRRDTSSEVTNMGTQPAPEYYEYRSQQPNIRDYNGPLSLGDPGVSASLWQESRGTNDMFRDDRAWQPMDLLTIIVLENSEGSKEADTEVKEKSSISAAISNLLGLESTVAKTNPQVNLDNLVTAATTNDYKGEGETTRKGKLKASISAMVAEVLPSGILRIEGEKIISVNSEEQVMKISGLVRPRDVNSRNEIDSAKIANMRIDYYGRGVVGDYQDNGWGAKIIKKVWPF
jgi:flagellar L-ring protein precursor FlgH